MKEIIRQLGEYINNCSHSNKIIESIYYILCDIVYKKHWL